MSRQEVVLLASLGIPYFGSLLMCGILFSAQLVDENYPDDAKNVEYQKLLHRLRQANGARGW